MTLTVQTNAARRSRGSGRRRPAGRRRDGAPPSLAVPEPRGRLQDLPAALPLPHHRPAARAQEPRRGPRHAGALGAGAPLRPPGRRSAPSRPRRSSWSRPGPSCARSPASPSCSRSPRTTARRPTPSAPESVEAWLLSAGQAGREVLHARGPDPHPAARPRGTGRGHPARRAAAARLRRPAGRRPERRAAGGRLQDRRGAARGVRGQGPVPDEVLRAGALAHPRRRGRPAQAALPQGRRRADLRPRRGRAGPLRAHPRRHLGGHRAGGGHRRLPARTRPGSATGATTRPSAPPGAALPRRSRSRPPRRPAGRRCRSSRSTDRRSAGRAGRARSRRGATGGSQQVRQARPRRRPTRASRSVRPGAGSTDCTAGRRAPPRRRPGRR